MPNNNTVRLAYGKDRIPLKVEKDWNVTVIEPKFVKGASDPGQMITKALNNPIGIEPLHKIIRHGDKVAIIFNDITRPTPNKLIIETLLKELRSVPSSDIALFNAVGTHRFNTKAELRKLIGNYLMRNFKVIQNSAFEMNTLQHVGISSFGNEILINKDLMACNVKILTGFIEPHFFAGFSGGGKAIMPGMAGINTILKNHNSVNIKNKNSSWGITFNNPIWEEVQEVAVMCNASFLINVTLNRDKEITGVFAGNIKKAHLAGIEYVRQTAMVQVSSFFDIVITTNSGFPLDQNLYQTVKGISAAARIVKPGGIIIAAAECQDGIPDHGLFSKLMQESANPTSLLDRICSSDFSRQDQWQAQILAMIQIKAEIFVYSDNLSDEQLRKMKIKKCYNIHELVETFRMKHGNNISICILPEGPQTIPYIKES